MRKISFFLFVLLIVLCSSCTTIIFGTHQNVYFNSTPPGASVYVCGKNTGRVTPCLVKVKRRVKPTRENRRNEQFYELKLDGYFDYDFKDRRKLHLLPFGLDILSFLIAIKKNQPKFTGNEIANKRLNFSFNLSSIITLPLDFLTGSIYKYQRKINGGFLIKKEIQREPQIVYIHDTIAKPVEKKERLSKIYAVVIGVSQYQDSSLNLEYADDDAQLFYNYLKSPHGGSLPSNQITLLLNGKATRANIIKALNTQFKNAFEEDMVMVYIASHGVPSSMGNKLYFLGSDTEKDNLEGTGISQNDILEAINNCKAEKKVWIADACHAGGMGVDALTMRGEEEVAKSNMVNRLMSGIADYRQNLILLSASSAGETSRESPLWGGGHGVFTYYLVEGLKGAADSNQSGLVDIRELYEYTRDKVSAATYKKQFPELKGVYKDRFPMSVITPE